MNHILVWSIRLALTAGFAGVLLLMIHRRSAAQRNLVLRIALVVAWLLPIAALFAPRIEVSRPSFVEALAAKEPVEGIIRAKKSIVSVPNVGVHQMGAVRNSIPNSSAPDAPKSVPWSILYWTGVGILLLRWLLGLFGLQRLRRAATETEERQVWRADVPVPATYGRTILIPKGSENWPEQRVRAAILHERAHVRRGDWLWQTFAGGLAAMHWFNPVVWVLLRLLRDTAETAADDAVLAAGLPASDYARELIAVAATASQVGSAVAMARRGGVKDRVASIVAVTRDRRPPTRRAAGLLAMVLAVSGVAVAGLVVRAVRTNEQLVRVADIRQISPIPTARWSLAGLPVATPFEAAMDRSTTLGYAPQAKRRVEIRFAVDGFVASDMMRIWVDKPATVVVYGSPHGNGQPSEGTADGAMDLVLEAPLKASTAHIRVGRSTGRYQKYPRTIPFTATSEPISWPEGTFPGAMIAFTFPSDLEAIDSRVFVLTDKGRVEVRDNEYEYTNLENGVPKAVYIAIDNPAHVRGIGIETRSYKVATFDIPLAPQAPLAPPNQPDPKHTIKLIRLSEGGHAWLPDGTPAKSVGTIASRYKPGPHQRQLTLAFRVQGETWFKPSLAPNVGDKYAMDGDWSGFIAVPGKPNERIGVVTTIIPDKLAKSPVTVLLEANPWIVHADQTVGSGSSQARLATLKSPSDGRNKGWTTYRITLDGVAPIAAEREVNIALLDQNDEEPSSVMEHRATKEDSSYTVAVQSVKPIKRVILESYAVDRARFEDVHLFPSDTTLN